MDLRLSWDHRRWYSIFRAFDEDDVEVQFMAIVSSPNGLIWFDSEAEYEDWTRDNW